ALVSTPSFDPNPLASHISAAEGKAKTKLDRDPQQPLINRAISQTYPPGSTFKLVVEAAALSDGMSKDTKLPTAATIKLPDGVTPLSNFGFETCPGNTMFAALAYSCNTAFATLAGRLGRDKLAAQATAFGIGEDTPTIPIPVATSELGPMADPDAVFQSGIGQRDVRLTPLQDAMTTATIANGGRRMQPQLVRKVLASDLSTLTGFSATQADQAISPQVADTLKQMMESSEVHTSGGGKRADLKIASKTGTAEHGLHPKRTPPHAWYTAFAPADRPQVAVAVLVENGGNRGLAATGSSVAAGVGRTTIDAAVGGP
ncbi:MAG: penicillin-binding transpeptidase domain-containing protein, partial [Sciscionella sp.]